MCVSMLLLNTNLLTIPKGCGIEGAQGVLQGSASGTCLYFVIL